MASPADNQAIAVANKDEEEQHYSYARQLASTVSLPMVLLSAFRLNIFEIIAKAGPGAQLSPSQIVAQLSSKNPDSAFMVDRMLRLLASHSVVTCSAKEADDGIPRVYGLAPVAKYFVRNPDLGGASMGSLLALQQNKVFIDSWYALDDAVLEGGVPFKKIHGANTFEYIGKDPEFNQVFNQAMFGIAAFFISRLLDSYKGFHELKTLVDVGGGLGITISKIINKYPTIQGTNFDLPHVVQRASTYPGVQHIGGNMFESVPKGDAIFMKWILHDWDDEHCIKLLKNCYSSLPDNGKVIVVDAIFPTTPDTTSSSVKANCQMDLIMLTQISGGKERSEEEFLALATASGFKGIKKQCFVCDLWVMEFYK